MPKNLYVDKRNETIRHTCLLVHEFIVVSKEGSELRWSVGQHFEDIRQKTSLEEKI